MARPGCHVDNAARLALECVHLGVPQNGEMPVNCAPSGFRTPDPLIKSQLLYQLS